MAGELRWTSTPSTFVEARIYLLESLGKYIQEYLSGQLKKFIEFYICSAAAVTSDCSSVERRHISTYTVNLSYLG
ncbi:hypothetical protein PVAP13_6NG116725 [Panicum virgatum]|uniref:Uncharacterized protein n=1 Tax=Panicum virgatum TaxID=38727 RepID=A0A8T0QVK8_PANVG|nr:hypothetical protein PVAP13_6NG116725 [Panicum virgatum]KAG2577176.1 hypothetical protein PVAP13_6NG116725 [Panicum virgatum]KAG2577177.1 hypothetical protein PVAP13_6NG116725 [Panicum virgatum]KAG2577178.1 hypothetical protein PVAP13_6NG116725 [Panicum virgatum]